LDSDRPGENGLITTAGSIEPFIATLGAMGIYRGLRTWLSRGGAITLRSTQDYLTKYPNIDG